MHKAKILKLAGTVVLGLGMAMAGFAQSLAPEIDASTAVNALALLSGALLIIRSRKG